MSQYEIFENSDLLLGSSSDDRDFDDAVLCNLIINYLPHDVDDILLKNLFIEHGEVIMAKVVRDKQTRKSLGYGFVKYLAKESAENAIRCKNGLMMGNKTIKVSYARPASEDIKNCKLYVTNLPKDFGEADVIDLFQQFGEIIECRVLRDPSTGINRGVAFVQYNIKAQAQMGLSLNGYRPRTNDRQLVVKFAEDQQKRKDRRFGDPNGNGLMMGGGGMMPPGNGQQHGMPMHGGGGGGGDPYSFGGGYPGTGGGVGLGAGGRPLALPPSPTSMSASMSVPQMQPWGMQSSSVDELVNPRQQQFRQQARPQYNSKPVGMGGMGGMGGNNNGMSMQVNPVGGVGLGGPRNPPIGADAVWFTQSPVANPYDSRGPAMLHAPVANLPLTGTPGIPTPSMLSLSSSTSGSIDDMDNRMPQVIHQMVKPPVGAGAYAGSVTLNISNLPENADIALLHDLLAPYGRILSAQIDVIDSSAQNGLHKPDSGGADSNVSSPAVTPRTTGLCSGRGRVQIQGLPAAQFAAQSLNGAVIYEGAQPLQVSLSMAPQATAYPAAVEPSVSALRMASRDSLVGHMGNGNMGNMNSMGGGGMRQMASPPQLHGQPQGQLGGGGMSLMPNNGMLPQQQQQQMPPHMQNMQHLQHQQQPYTLSTPLYSYTIPPAQGGGLLGGSQMPPQMPPSYMVDPNKQQQRRR